MKSWDATTAKKPTPISVTKRLVGDVEAALKALCIVRGHGELPCWVGEAPAGWQDARDVLCFSNGILHLGRLLGGEDGYFLPPTARFFTIAGREIKWTEPSETAQPERWLAFLDELWGGSPGCIELLQEWFAYVLAGDADLQKILLLLGPPRSGKGTIAHVLGGLLGKVGVAGPTLASLGTPFGLEPLLGKPLAVISDCRISARSDQALIAERLLSISGGDLIGVDRKNKSTVHTVLPTRLMVFTNEMPKVRDASGALANRFVVLPMTESFLDREDPRLGNRLRAELPAILHWAIEGLQRLRERGRFVPPAAGLALVEYLARLASPIREFVNDQCYLGAGHEVRKEIIFGRYRWWCGHQNTPPMSAAEFGLELMTAFPRIRPGRPREHGERVHTYRGVTCPAAP
jgi:putative DNA primase/helicase